MPPYDMDGSEGRGRREVVVASIWVAASILLLVLPVPVQQGISSVLRATVLAPFVLTQESLNRTRIRAVDIELLQARYDSTVALLASQSAMGAENARLRALLDLRERTGPAFVSASAMRSGTRGSESMFLLDVGSDDGVAANDPVVAAEGLVGVIREVGPGSSLAMDWTHPDFRVSVMTPDAETFFGIIEARSGAFGEEDRLVLPGVPFYTTLEPGQVLVTSGQGAVYPRGIRVGTILSLAEAEAGWRRGYWVRAAVEVGSVTHVLVITGDEGRPVSELTHLWAPAGVEPGVEPDVEAGVEPGLEPGVEPGLDPGVEPGDPPGPGAEPDPDAAPDAARGPGVAPGPGAGAGGP